MKMEYVDSEERYYNCIIRKTMVCLDNSNIYHKKYEVFRDGVRVGIGTNKRELKKMIKELYF